MTKISFVNSIGSYGLHLVCIMFGFSVSTNAAEPLDGFRDLKFGMTQQEVKALTTCSTSHECMYELSNKNRYLQLSYEPESTTPGTDSKETPRLVKITIDMGHHSDEWYQQLQMILGSSYRLTHDFTDKTMNAFLTKDLEELKTGYEDGQVVLKVVRRPFGNIILKVVYQNTTLATEFIRQTRTPQSATP